MRQIFFRLALLALASCDNHRPPSKPETTAPNPSVPVIRWILFERKDPMTDEVTHFATLANKKTNQMIEVTCTKAGRTFVINDPALNLAPGFANVVFRFDNEPVINERLYGTGHVLGARFENQKIRTKEINPDLMINELDAAYIQMKIGSAHRLRVRYDKPSNGVDLDLSLSDASTVMDDLLSRCKN